MRELYSRVKVFLFLFSIVFVMLILMLSISYATEDSNAINKLRYKNYGGYQEGLFIELESHDKEGICAYFCLNDGVNRSSNKIDWVKIDDELIYYTSNGEIRIDIIGLKKGIYDVKITKGENEIIIKNIEVFSHDRSGYAHYNMGNDGRIQQRDEGVGAYNNDGTLKDNAVVFYITQDNVNDINLDNYSNDIKKLFSSYEKVTIVDLFNNLRYICKNGDRPIAIRIIGKISTNQYRFVGWDYKMDTWQHLEEVCEFLHFNQKERKFEYSSASDGETLSLDDIVDNGINSLEIIYSHNIDGLPFKVQLFGDRLERVLKNDNGENIKIDENGNPVKDNDGKYMVDVSNENIKYKNGVPLAYSGTNYSVDVNGTVTKTYPDFTMYFGLVRANLCKNITVEGVGTEAELVQFGLEFTQGNSIEVRNLTFTDYPDKALRLRGSMKTATADNKTTVTSSVLAFGNYWIHNNTFNSGKLNFDVRARYSVNRNDSSNRSYESDDTSPAEGCHNVTFSYNHYINVNKGLLLGSNTYSVLLNLTIHHNHFENIIQRVPNSRNVNIHLYNNYYDAVHGNTKVDQREDSIVFSEANYYSGFEADGKYGPYSPFRTPEYAVAGRNGYVKSYGDIIYGIKHVSDNSNRVFVCDDRELLVDRGNDSTVLNVINGEDYTNFDTNPELFYYDSVHKCSLVDDLNDAEEAKKMCIEYAGTLKKTTNMELTKNNKVEDFLDENSSVGNSFNEKIYDENSTNENTLDYNFNDEFLGGESEKYIDEFSTEDMFSLIKADDWAIEEMKKANEIGLIPETVAESDFTTAISRSDFATVAVKLYVALTGLEPSPAFQNPFIDTNDDYVLKAYALGITKGISETEFGNGTITREQMATMITRALNVAGIDTTVDLDTVDRFDDDDEMHDWGRSSVYCMALRGIIKGVGNNKFNPLGATKIEEAIAIALRCVEVWR